MNDKITEQLFSAVDTIVQKRLSALEYDKTILCTIINNSHKDKGEYVVSDGSTSFVAYSDNVYYGEGTQVYVNIPRGDYGNQKMITGRYVSSESESFNWISPLERFVPLTENLVGGSEFVMQNNSILANAKTLDENRTPICSKVIYNPTELNNSDSYAGFNRLSLTISFRTALKELKTLHGTYGVKIYLTCEKKTNTGTSTEELVIAIDSNSMQGNPFSFNGWFAQSKVYEINDIGRITSIRAELYQQGDFIDVNGNYLPYSSQNMEDGKEEYLPDNIEIQDIRIALGYGLDDIKEEQAYIYTLDSNTYKAQAEKTINDNTKRIGLRWIKKKNGQYIAIGNQNDPILENEQYQIYWYQKVNRAGVSSLYGGPLWQHLSEFDNQFSFDFTPDVMLPSEEIKAVIRYLFDKEGLEASGDKGDKEQFYKKYTSNILRFENENPSDLQNLDLINALKITIPNNEIYKGIYRIYNPDTGYLLNSREAYTKRTLQATYKSLITADTLLDGAESIEWFIPKINTMIQPPTKGIEYSDSDVFEDSDANFYHIKRAIPKADEKEPGVAERSTQQIYRIKNYYTPDYTNNTIQCIVTRNGLVYTASISLAFGPAGTMGSDYSIAIHLTDIVELNAQNDERIIASNVGAVPADLGANQWVKIYAELFDCNGRFIPDAELQWQWYTPGKNKDIHHNLIIKDSVNGILKSNTCYVQWDASSTHLSQNEILQVAVNIQDDLNHSKRMIYNYFPVPSKKDNSISYLEGASTIIYDTTGARPTYYRNPYKLYNQDNMTINNINYNIQYIYCGNKNDNINLIKEFAPKIVSRNYEYFLRPCNLYVQNLDTIYYIAVSNAQQEILWSQPIYIAQNRYPSTMLTEWDGNLTIDEKNSTILSTMLGAGKKDLDGTFSGVLLGDVEQATDAQKSNSLGLYGYYHGIQSYGFNSNGTAFIGTPSTGRIEFNGKTGTIYNTGYNKGQGIMINLGDESHSPFIELKDLKEKNGNFLPYSVKISATSPYLEVISGDKSQPILYVGQDKYYFKSKNWAINSDGTAVFSDIKITNKNGNSSSLDWGNNFKVGTDGILIANGAKINGSGSFTGDITANSGTFNGTVNATSGNIGGCSIENGQLHVGKAHIEQLNIGDINYNGRSIQPSTLTLIANPRLSQDIDHISMVTNITVTKNSKGYVTDVQFTTAGTTIVKKETLRYDKYNCSVLSSVSAGTGETS